MNDTRQPVSGSFAKIKRHLDPAYSYVIFEKPSESGKEGEFQPVFEAIVQLDRSSHDWQYFRDEARGTSLLVVRFDPGRTDQIVHEFLNVGLPEGITFYAYGSHGTGSTSQP